MTEIANAVDDTDRWDSWNRWHKERESTAVAPTGQAALTGTHWISAFEESDAVDILDLPGKWYLTGSGVTGIDLPSGYPSSTVELLPGESVTDNSITLTAIERAGKIAVRTFDRAADTLTSFSEIAAFPPSQQWAVPATFVEDIQTVGVTSIDGFESNSTTAGWVHFTIDGVDHRLQTSSDGTQLRIVFSDASTALGTHRFRFLSVPTPDATGNTVIDFNFAYLPPCAFSDHFLCPLPALENRLNISVTAGERSVIRGELPLDKQR